MTDDESRPTTILRPLVMIIDKPPEVVDNAALQRDIATRMMQPIELESMGYAPLEVLPPKAVTRNTTPPRVRAATGVAVTEPRISFYIYLWVAFCVIAGAALILLAP